MVGPQRPQFVLFGSSIVQISYSNCGWGAHLADIYSRKADIVLRGYNGWNSRLALQVLHQVFPKDAPVQPDLVIVYFGGNDATAPNPFGLGPHVPLQEYIENMRKISLHLKSLSDKTRVILLTCPPVNEEQICAAKSVDEVLRTNHACGRYAEACLGVGRDTGVDQIDLWNAIQKRENWKDLCFTDGVHLSSEGSKVVVDEILKVLKEAEWTPSLYWKLMPSEFTEKEGKEFLLSGAAEWTLYRENWR